MNIFRKTIAAALSACMAFTMLTVPGLTVFADSSFNVSGTAVIATDLAASTGVAGAPGLSIYADLSGQPVGVTDEYGAFSVEVPAGTQELVFTNKTYENGTAVNGTGNTVDRAVALSGSTDIYNAVIPVIVNDYNADGNVNAADKIIFSKTLRATPESANYNVFCNFNGDAVINAADTVIFQKFLNKVKTNYAYASLEFQGHEHSYSAVVTEPACTEGGYTTYTCSLCGDTYTGNETAALGHDFGEWTETAAPTCTATGTETRECSRCDATETRDVSALGHTAGEAVQEGFTAADCTNAGSYDSVVYCTVCNAELSRETVTIPATGHNYTAVVTSPTCTEGGYTTYTCSLCGDTYTGEQTAASGHSYQATVTAPTCTTGGYTTYVCSVCGDTYTGDQTAPSGHTSSPAVSENETPATCTQTGSYESVVYCSVCNAELSRETVITDALGHDFGEWTVTAAAVCATCTAAGSTAVETRTCSRCNATETTGGEVVPATGHNYQPTVTAATCTEGGYTTYTCSACGDSYTADATAALGHNWVAGSTVAPTHSADGYTNYTCPRCSATKQDDIIPALNIKVKLPNTASYLYRAGNANSIALGKLFEIEDANKNTVDSSAVTVTIQNSALSAAGTFTANASDWTAATVKFTGTGVVTVTVKQAGYAAATLKLEVVAGSNITSETLGNVTSANAVLLNDVNIPTKITINNNRTLYGNGFTVTDTRSDTSGTSGYINMNGNATIDNAVILGQVYPSAVTSGINNQYYSPGIWITGNANIYNSYVSEAKTAVQIDGGTVNLINSTFDGGAVSNLQIGGGNVTLKNCVTTTSTRGGLKSLGIRGTSADCKINIEGTFTQYNWLKSSDMPSTYSSVLNSLYNDSNYAYTYNSQKYLNMGIFFITDASAITLSMAQDAINDSTSNSYGYTEKTYASVTGTIYTAKSSMGSAAMINGPAAYSPTTHGQYYTQPSASFNYTLNDFSTDDKNYCTYNSTTGVTQISFEEDSSMNWNSNILTVTKSGNTISPTVTMNGVDYTGQSIPFTQAGSYTVNYTYTDPYNYDANGNAFSVTYTKSVPINVTVVEHGVEIYHPDFTYADIGGTTASRQVEATVSGAKRIYVMPDVTSTSSTIESKTVGGQTVYYPVVQVPASNSSGGNFSSGQLYYFAPAFKNINIVDYDQSNQTAKTAKYTYNSSTQKWPHNVSGSSQPDTSVYYYTATNTSSATNRPYGRSMNESYYGYKYVSSRGGLCFSSNQIEKENNANSQVVEFYYKGTDDITYYYYIKYSFAYGKGSSGACVADGSLVTMADGTQKPVEDVQVGDMVKTWSFYNGCYEDKPIVVNMYHGTKEREVLNLQFSDGSDLDIIYDHGLFDADLNSNVYINTGNVESYVGDRFIKLGAGGENEKVELTGYEITTRTAGAYAPLTAENNNCIINGLYTICSEEECHGLFEHFEIGDGMRYDEEKMQADIEKYGVYTYDDLSDCMSEELFNSINAKYYKISAEKYGISREEIARIFNQYM